MRCFIDDISFISMLYKHLLKVLILIYQTDIAMNIVLQFNWAMLT